MPQKETGPECTGPVLQPNQAAPLIARLTLPPELVAMHGTALLKFLADGCYTCKGRKSVWRPVDATLPHRAKWASRLAGLEALPRALPD